MARKPLVGVSTKMYFSLSKTRDYIGSLQSLFPKELLDKIDVFIIPDFLCIPEASKTLESTSIYLGAQDCFWEDSGAYTGEVSPQNLAEFGVRFVEIGHAERRAIFHETDEDVVRKSVAASRNGMVPLVCIGEKTRDDTTKAAQSCIRQIDPILKSLSPDAELVIAYEPVWAIGQPKPASTDYIVDVVNKIRQHVDQTNRPGLVRILYGGSAGPGLFTELAPALDGLFLGRFAHDVEAFKTVATEIVQTRS